MKCYLCLKCKTMSMHSNKESITTNASVELSIFIYFICFIQNFKPQSMVEF